MVAVGRMRKGTRLNKHEGSVIYLQAISGLWPGVIFAQLWFRRMESSEWGGLDDGHPWVEDGVWCNEWSLTRNL